MAEGTTASAFYERELEIQRRLGNRAGEAWVLYSIAFWLTSFAAILLLSAIGFAVEAEALAQQHR